MPILRFLPLLALTAAVACATGVDKDRSDPDPAVGRSFGGADSSSARNSEASHPVRNFDTTAAPSNDPGNGTP